MFIQDDIFRNRRLSNRTVNVRHIYYNKKLHIRHLHCKVLEQLDKMKLGLEITGKQGDMTTLMALRSCTKRLLHLSAFMMGRMRLMQELV